MGYFILKMLSQPLKKIVSLTKKNEKIQNYIERTFKNENALFSRELFIGNMLI